MNCYLKLIVLFFISAISPNAYAQHYDEYFTDATLRIDYIFGGNQKRQFIALDKLNSMPKWYGKRKNLADVPLEGNGQIIVRSHKDGVTIYRNSFSTLFQEWLTYDEALTTTRSFENVFLVPMPKDSVEITVKLFNNRRETTVEMTHVVNPNDILIHQPERFDEMLRIYIGFIKTVHSAEMDAGTLPMARDIFIGYLDVIKNYLTAEQHECLKKLLSALPDDLHIVHGDFQMKNVMLVDNEPMLIDMDTLSTGQPIFDLQALYVTYVLFGEDDPNNLRDFLGLPNDWGSRIWQSIIRYYFDTDDAAKLAEISDKIRLAASVRFLYLLAVTDLKNGELGTKRIRRAQQYISELISKYDSLIL